MCLVVRLRQALVLCFAQEFERDQLRLLHRYRLNAGHDAACGFIRCSLGFGRTGSMGWLSLKAMYMFCIDLRCWVKGRWRPDVDVELKLRFWKPAVCFNELRGEAVGKVLVALAALLDLCLLGLLLV